MRYGHNLPEGPFIVGDLPPLGVEISYPRADGMVNGQDILNVWVDVAFVDDTGQPVRTERCPGLVRAWTSELVYVWVESARGRYVVWVSAAQVTRRRGADDDGAERRSHFCAHDPGAGPGD